MKNRISSVGDDGEASAIADVADCTVGLPEAVARSEKTVH